MTKKDILMLLEDLHEDDEVYMMDNGKVAPICLGDSGMSEVNFDDGFTERVIVFAPCHCHDDNGGGVPVPELCYN